MWTVFEHIVKKCSEHDFLSTCQYDKEKKAFTNYTFITYGEGFKIIEKAAYGFNALGLKPSNIITECCKNCAKWVLTKYGMLCQAVTTSPLRSELNNFYYKPKFAVLTLRRWTTTSPSVNTSRSTGTS